MRASPLAAAAVLLLAAAAPAHANWSLGANLGIVVVDPTEEGVDAVTMFGWPSQGFVNVVGAPGLRLGFMGENPRHQFYVDSAFWLLSGDGATISTFTATGNYQYNFVGAGGSTGPYLTGGLGFANVNLEDFFGDSATSPLFGAGVGVQHRLAHGHGTVRAEVRFDRVLEGNDGVIPATNNLGIKLGFDLWGR